MLGEIQFVMINGLINERPIPLVGFVGENDARQIKVITFDDMSTVSVTELVIGDIEAGIFESEQKTIPVFDRLSGGYVDRTQTTLSIYLNEEMLGDAGLKFLQLVMYNETGEIVKKTNQFIVRVGDSNTPVYYAPGTKTVKTLETYVKEITEEAIKLAFGLQEEVTSSNDFVNKKALYVYKGNEEDYKNGYWYYYDDTQKKWLPGGPYKNPTDEVVRLLAQKQDTLTFDSTPTEDSQNPVTSDGVFRALAGHQITMDEFPINGSTNPVTSDGLYRKFGEVDAQHQSLSTRVGRIQEEQTDLSNDVQQNTTDIAQNTSDISSHGVTIAEHQTSISENTDAIEEVRGIANSASTKADAVDDRLDNIIVESGTSDAETIAARTNANTGVTYTTLGQRLDAENSEIKEDLSDKFKAGNNLFALNGDYENTFSGVHIIIKNGVITINGTSTTPITLKLTGGYDIASRAKDAWENEVVSFFEIGKTYHYGIETVSGTFPDGVGCPGRANRTSVISVSIPVKTIEIQPHYIMLYIPTGANVNCSFIPYYIESYTGNNLYKSEIADNVRLSRKQLPTAEFNHFTVTVKDANGNDKITQCVVALPSSYDVDGKPTTLIMFCHGREGIVTETEWADSADKLALIRHFTSAGYGVFDVDATSHPSAGAVDVGCPQLMDSYIKAFEYIKNTYNVDDRLILYGYSFGTFALMNMICWYPALIRTACISAMRASVRAVYDRGEPYQSEIAENFGFTDGYSAEKMQGYDPYANIVTVGNEDMLMKQIPPLKIITSTGDTLELEQSHILINAWRASGNVIDWKEVTGSNHHDMCYLSGTASSLKDEVTGWFNRFI